ncbi:sporulation protein [Mangrovibacillus cuniculi]|uniref:Sporulation protein n=1 Tax=Mangrovibacillus cuniculi TaxID=2593652 RepID=A0A7S8CAY1_9BACI|nr:sporulation protein [Mangrovibacillus cuniculi]QPC46608.1 sporulation protein [Mangrovibacillus cuniculi]
MSFFQRALAKIGVGGATVDAQLSTSRVRQGETVSGKILLTGGTVDQEMDGITIAVKTVYEKEKDDHKQKIPTVIHKVRVTDNFSLKAREEKLLDFTLQIPATVPVTYGSVRVWLETEMDIKGAIDPEDKDFIEISPLPILKELMEGLENEGFKLRKVECEAAPRWMRSNLPFVQKFEFVPVSGAFRSKFDEIELYIVHLSDDSIEGVVELDKRGNSLGGWLAEALDMDESYHRVHLTRSSTSVTNQFIDIISKV